MFFFNSYKKEMDKLKSKIKKLERLLEEKEKLLRELEEFNKNKEGKILKFQDEIKFLKKENPYLSQNFFILLRKWILNVFQFRILISQHTQYSYHIFYFEETQEVKNEGCSFKAFYIFRNFFYNFGSYI